MEQVTKKFFIAKDKFTVTSYTHMLEKKLYNIVLRYTPENRVPYKIVRFTQEGCNTVLLCLRVVCSNLFL